MKLQCPDYSLSPWHSCVPEESSLANIFSRNATQTNACWVILPPHSGKTLLWSLSNPDTHSHHSRLLRNFFKYFCGNSTNTQWSPFLLVTQVTSNRETSPSFLWPIQISSFEFLLLAGIQTVVKSRTSGCTSLIGGVNVGITFPRHRSSLSLLILSLRPTKTECCKVSV